MIDQINHSNQRAPVVVAEAATEHKIQRRLEVAPVSVVRKQTVSSAREEVPREEVDKATQKLNRLMGIVDKRLHFKVHEKTGQVMVNIIDENTGEVLDQIPSKKVLDLLSSFRDFVGLLVDKKV